MATDKAEAESGLEQDWRADAAIDITAERCPMTFVRTRIALDKLAPGARLSVKLRGEEPLRNVPRSAEALGHRVVARREAADGVVELLIARAG